MDILRLYGLVLVLSLAMISCSRKVNDLEKDGFRGNVKSVREVQCDPTYREDRWVAGNPTSHARVAHYDRDGNYLESVTINEVGDTVGKTTCTRENGELVEEIYFARYFKSPSESTFFKASRTVLERVSDEQVNFEVWDQERIVTQGARFFNSKGRLLKQVQLINDREVVVHYVYEKGMLTENYQEETDGTRSATQLYDYPSFDNEGNWTEMLVYIAAERITPDVVIKRELEYY